MSVPAKPTRRSASPGRSLLLAGVALVSLLMAAPLVWMLLGSLRSNEEILRAPFALPEAWRWGQWSEAWVEGNLSAYAVNSGVVTALSVTLTVLLGAAAAYPLARESGATPRTLLLYLVGLVVPAQAAVVPLFLLLRSLRLLDTWWALVLPYVAWNLPVAVFVFYGFFRGQSTEPEEAARLDGCGPLAIFWRIALPIARPAAGVVAILTALAVWNELLFALLFVSSESARTLPLGLLAFSSAHTTDYGLTFAALSMMSLPLLVAYAFVQRWLIEGAEVTLA
ncbi:MAG: carbohydrate ABC transporter permease [Armatimonadota bacterium]